MAKSKAEYKNVGRLIYRDGVHYATIDNKKLSSGIVRMYYHTGSGHDHTSIKSLDEAIHACKCRN